MRDKEYSAMKAESDAIEESFRKDLAALRASYSERFARQDELKARMRERAEANVDGLKRDEIWNIYEDESDYQGPEPSYSLSLVATDAGCFQAVAIDGLKLERHLDPRDYGMMRDGVWGDDVDDPMIGAYYLIRWDGKGHAAVASKLSKERAHELALELLARGNGNG